MSAVWTKKKPLNQGLALEMVVIKLKTSNMYIWNNNINFTRPCT